MDRLAETLIKNNEHGKSADLLFAFRCFAVDTITAYCFGNSVDALNEPDWQVPIVVAMDNSLPAFHFFKHFPLIRRLVFTSNRRGPTTGEKVKKERSNLEPHRCDFVGHTPLIVLYVGPFRTIALISDGAPK
jgi:hypothetical protein